MLQPFAKICVVLAIFFLSFRLGGTLEAPNIKPSEIFILISAVLTSADLLRKRFRIPNDLKRSFQKILLGLGIFYVSLAVGTAISLLRFQNLPLQFIGLEYLRISFAATLFLLIFFYGATDRKFLGWVFFVLLSPLLFVGMAFIPGAAETFNLTAGSRFRGFFSDPNYFANFSMIAAIFLFAIAFRGSTTFSKRLLATAGGIPIMSLIIRSGSRSSWIGLACGLVLAVILITRSSSTKMKAGLFAILMLLLFSLGSFFLLSNEQKTEAFGRLGYSIDFTRGFQSLSASDFQVLPEKYFITEYSQDRTKLWRQSLYFIAKNPLGYGPGYYRLLNIKSPLQEHRPSHNVFLEILLAGGMLGFSVLTIFLFTIMKQLIRTRSGDYIWIGTNAAFFGVLFGTVFLDAISLRWLWLLGGMLLAQHHALSRK